MLLFIIFYLVAEAHANWAWLGGSQTANVPSSYLGYFIEGPSVTPGGIRSAAYIINGSYIITYGGRSSVLTNNLWRYNIDSGMWSLMFISTSSTAAYGTRGLFSPIVVPTPTEYSMMFLDTGLNSLFVFGGLVTIGQELFDNNMFEFNLDRNMWRWVHGPGVSGDLGIFGERGVESPLNVPPARVSHAHFYDEVTRKLMFTEVTPKVAFLLRIIGCTAY